MKQEERRRRKLVRKTSWYAAAYHEICNLTTNVAVSRAEAETWKKCLLNTADEKIKMQRHQLTLNLLRKLQRVGIGVNSVEIFELTIFLKPNCGRGIFGK